MTTPGIPAATCATAAVPPVGFAAPSDGLRRWVDCAGSPPVRRPAAPTRKGGPPARVPGTGWSGPGSGCAAALWSAGHRWARAANGWDRPVWHVRRTRAAAVLGCGAAGRARHGYARTGARTRWEVPPAATAATAVPPQARCTKASAIPEAPRSGWGYRRHCAPPAHGSARSFGLPVHRCGRTAQTAPDVQDGSTRTGARCRRRSAR